jgi:hypothetical protein
MIAVLKIGALMMASIICAAIIMWLVAEVMGFTFDVAAKASSYLLKILRLRK